MECIEADAFVIVLELAEEILHYECDTRRGDGIIETNDTSLL